MKTTLELPDALFQEAKEFAAKHGMPFREVIEVSLRKHLAASSAKAKPFKLRKAPTWNAEALIEPGDWPTIRSIIYEGHGE